MEHRKLNLNAINGMDLRDFNLDQQTVPEIINLKKGKNGWQIRDSEHDVLTGLDVLDNVNCFIMKDQTKVVVHINNSIITYLINDDELGTMVDKFDFSYEFKLYKTNYPDVYFQIDTTNHKSYILEFTDRVMTLINDAGDTNLSTELLLNEYDSATGDFTWGGMCRHAELSSTTNSTTRTYTTSIDKYCINYDTFNAATASEWSSVSLLQQYDSFKKVFRYVIVSGVGSDTYVYLFDWNDTTPYKWVSKLKLSGTNVFKTNNTNGNLLSRNMDIISKYSNYTTSIPWSQYTKDNTLITSYINTIFSINNNYSMINVINSGLYAKLNNETDFSFKSNYSWRSFDPVSNYFAGSNQSGTIKLIGYYRNFPYSINDNDFVNIYGNYGTETGDINAYPQYIVSDNNSIIYSACNNASTIVKYMGGSVWQSIGSCPSGTITSLEFIGEPYNYLIVGSTDGIYRYDGTTFISLGTVSGNYGKNTSFFKVIGNDIVAITYADSVVKLTNGTGTWTVVGTGLGYPICLEYIQDRNMLIAGTADNGAKYLIGTSGAWAQYGTNLNTNRVEDIFYNINDNKTYAVSGYGALYDFYGVYVDNYNEYFGNVFFNIYIPNSDKISCLNTTDGSTLAYNNSYITSNITTAKSVKAIDIFYTPCSYVQYLSCMCNNYLKIFVESVKGTKEVSTSVNYFIQTSSVNYNNFNFLTASYNKAYETNYGQNVNYKVQSILVGYNSEEKTRIDNWFLRVGWNTTTNTCTAMLEKITTGGAIVNTSPYFLSNNYVSASMAYNTNIQTNGKINYIYICADKKLYKLPMTGNQVTDADINSIEFLYNSEISRYADIDGNILNAVVSDTEGYVKTEINKSKPLPLRPYFTADATGTDNTNTFTRNVITVSGDTNNLITSANIFITFNSNTVANVITDNGRLYWNVTTCTATNSRTVTVYNTYARTCIIMQGSRVIANGATAVVNLCAFNQSYTVNAQSNVTITIPAANITDVNSNSQIITLQTYDSPEYFNLYEMTLTDGRSFRTPVEVGGGALQLINSDDYSLYHKYWLFYLLYSGLYDDTIPYINIAKGTKHPINGTYDFKFWKQDPNFINEVYNNYTGSENLPARFSNIEANFQDADVPALQTYVINDKVYQKWGDTYRDKFSAYAFWQQTKNVLFEIQDMTFSAAELAMVLDYSNKALYWSTGFKFINLLNKGNLLSKPTAIQEVNQNTGIVACENDLYYVSGSDESNIVLSYIGSNIGLEQANYKSLITNGSQGFFYNRKGIWMVDRGNVVAIYPPIEDYLYRQSSGNVLGVDIVNNLLYIPLDITRWKDIDGVQTHLQTVLKAGDYDAVIDTTTVYDTVYGVFNWKDLTYSIYAYELPSGELAENNNFIGNFKDHVIIRSGNKIIIPEYKEVQGTENPLCRITLKKMAFGSAFELKKLDTLLTQFYNNQNTDLVRYGVDYLKLYIILDGEAIWQKKYGDFNSTGYSDCEADSSVPNDNNVGFKNIKIPMGLDFHDIQIQIEFGRVRDTNVSVASINEIDLNVINKGSERNGIF